MASKMKITVSIQNDNGEMVVEKFTERTLPYIEEIEEQGFRAAFHDLETAVLEGRKEVCEKAVSEYLGAVSQKKQKMHNIPAI